MKIRTLLLLGAVLVGLAAYSARVPAAAMPLGDEANAALIAASLWHEHDLSFDHRDLLRAYHTWNEGPAGLTLFSNDGGRSMHFGRPLPYPLAALPFYALFGFRGLAVFNALLYLLLLGLFLRLRGAEGPGAVPLIAGTFFASAAFAAVFRLEPEVFLMACTALPLLAWWWLRKREAALAQGPPSRWGTALLLGSGALLAAAFVQEPLSGLLALPIAIDLVLRRRFRDVGLVLAGALLALALLSALQKKGTGEWVATGGAQRRTFAGQFPIESAEDLWQGYPQGDGAERQARFDRALAHLPRNLGYLLVGRQVGLLPYLPFALFALLLGLRGLRAAEARPRLLLLGAFAAYAVGVLLWRSDVLLAGGAGGPAGPRPLLAVAPAFLFLPESLRVGRWLLAPFLAAGLWTSGVLAASLSTVAARVEPGAHLTEAPFLRLPLETTLLSRDGLPGYALQSWKGSAWLVPVESFFVEERNPDGVWVRGASRSEVVVVSPQPLRRITALASSLSDQNALTLESGAERLTVRFDSEGKRQGTPVDLALAAPSARDIGFFAPGTPDYVYRFTIESSDGAIPARRRWHNRDPRYLGTFLDFTAPVR